MSSLFVTACMFIPVECCHFVWAFFFAFCAQSEERHRSVMCGQTFARTTWNATMSSSLQESSIQKSTWILLAQTEVKLPRPWRDTQKFRDRYQATSRKRRRRKYSTCTSQVRWIVRGKLVILWYQQSPSSTLLSDMEMIMDTGINSSA